MKTAVITSLVFAIAALAQDGGAKINTPASAVQCQPLQLSWSGGKAPYYVSIIPGGQPGGTIIHDFGTQDGTSLTWDVNQPEGTSLTLQVKDASGQPNYSDAFTVQKGTDTSCLNGESSSSNSTSGGSSGSSSGDSAGSSGSSTGGAAGSTASSTGDSKASGDSKSADSKASGSSTGTAKPAGSSGPAGSGAGRVVVSTGLVGAVALAAAALF